MIIKILGSSRLYFLTVIGILTICISCTENKPASKPKPPAEKTKKTPKRTGPAPVDGLTMHWGVSEKETGVEIADDLTIKNYYVIFDGSGSMEGSNCAGSKTKMQVAKEALKKFSSAVPSDANLGLLVFDDSGTKERLSLGTQNRETFVAEVEKVQPGGKTPLKRAMKTGVKKLQEQAIKQRGYGEYNLVVVTDGEASNGQDPTRVVSHMLFYSPILVHTIGFCIGEEHTLNQPDKILYKSAGNQQELMQGLEGVLAESESFDVLEFQN